MLSIVAILFVASAHGQDTITTNGADQQATAMSTDERLVKLKTSAQEMIDALSDKNFEKFADLTALPVIEKMGGRDKYIAFLKQDDAGVANVFVKTVFTVGDPAEPVAHKKDLFAVVPFNIKGTTAQKTVIATNASMIGISVDEGKTWKFVSDGAFFDFFPELEGKLTIPKANVSVTNEK